MVQLLHGMVRTTLKRHASTLMAHLEQLDGGAEAVAGIVEGWLGGLFCGGAEPLPAGFVDVMWDELLLTLAGAAGARHQGACGVLVLGCVGLLKQSKVTSCHSRMDRVRRSGVGPDHCRW